MMSWDLELNKLSLIEDAIKNGMCRIRFIEKLVEVADGVSRSWAYSNNNNALTLIGPIDIT